MYSNPMAAKTGMPVSQIESAFARAAKLAGTNLSKRGEIMKFNLTIEPCIPVLDAKGKPDLLSLRDTLTQAHELNELSHGSPVVTAGLLRLLVAVLTDIYEPRGIQDWQAIWTRGAFD